MTMKYWLSDDYQRYRRLESTPLGGPELKDGKELEIGELYCRVPRCFKPYRTSEGLHNHIRTIHKDIKPNNKLICLVTPAHVESAIEFYKDLMARHDALKTPKPLSPPRKRPKISPIVSPNVTQPEPKKHVTPKTPILAAKKISAKVPTITDSACVPLPFQQRFLQPAQQPFQQSIAEPGRQSVPSPKVDKKWHYMKPLVGGSIRKIPAADVGSTSLHLDASAGTFPRYTWNQMEKMIPDQGGQVPALHARNLAKHLALGAQLLDALPLNGSNTNRLDIAW